MARKLFFLIVIALSLGGSLQLKAESDTLWCCLNETLGHSYSSSQFHPNSRLIAYGGAGTPKIYLVEAATGLVEQTIDFGWEQGNIEYLAFNSDGSKMLFIARTYSAPIAFYEMDMNTYEKTLIAQEVNGFEFGYSPDDSIIFYKDSGKGLFLINADDKSLIRVIPDVEMFAYPNPYYVPHNLISISRDNSLIASTYRDKNANSYVGIYNVATGELVKTIKNAQAPCFSKTRDELFYLHRITDGYDELLRCDYNNGFIKVNDFPIKVSDYQYSSYNLSNDGNYLLVSNNDVTSTYNVNGVQIYTFPFIFRHTNFKGISPDLRYIYQNLAMLNGRFGVSSVSEMENNFIINQDTNFSEIYIHNNNEELLITNIKIVDITGNSLKEITGEALNNSALSISTNTLASGTYFLSISTDSGVFTHQFMIVR